MRQETHDIICTVIEDLAGREHQPDVEEVADVILGALAAYGDDLLDHLDPPQGLRRWLDSHGLSLVATSEVAPPRMWEEIEEDDEEQEDRGGLPVHELPPLQLGDTVRYETITRGPRGQSEIGGGTIVAMRQTAGEGLVITVRNGTSLTHLLPAEGDRVAVIAGS